MKTNVLLEAKINKLIEEFRKRPNNFFHEKEIHSFFFNLCRNQFCKASPKESGVAIDLFRQEYDTIWRYKRKSKVPFGKKYTNEGTTGAIDFVLLKKEFVGKHDLLTVINKHETRRSIIRPDSMINPAINVGIEFKMSHWTRTLSINNGDIKQLGNGLLVDCRKLAQELIPHAYAIAFSHGKSPEQKKVKDIVKRCKQEYAKYNSKGNIHIKVITPEHQVEL